MKQIKVIKGSFGPRKDYLWGWFWGITSSLIYSLLPICLFLSASLTTEDTPVSGFVLLGSFSLLGFLGTAGIGMKVFRETSADGLFDGNEIFWNKAKEEYIILEKDGSFIPAVKFFGKYLTREYVNSFEKDTELQEAMNSDLENRFKTQNNGYTIHATVKSITRS